MFFKNVTVIIPALDPDEKLINTVSELEEYGFDDIIVVDDGSDSEHQRFFPDVKDHPFCTVLHHRRNRGKGAALKTAFKYFLRYREGKSGVVTIDSDGQHLLKDIVACVEKMGETGGPVFGCRDFSLPQVPSRSRFGNRSTSLVLRLLCGIKLSDTQTGLRAIPAECIEDLISVKGTRYEYEINMIFHFKANGIKFTEVPIETVYIDNNAASHYRPIVDSIRVFKPIIAFCVSSLTSMLVEVIVFYLALKFFFEGKSDVFLATAVARVCSSILNFTLNRHKVFGNNVKPGKALLRYVILAVPLALISAFGVKGLCLLFGIEGEFLKTLIKVAVDFILFFVSYRIQQNWVFAPDKKHKESKETPAEKEAGEKLKASVIIRRILGCIGTAVLYIVIAVFLAAAVVAHGPSASMRDALVLSAMQASATKWVPALFLSEEEVQRIVDNSHVDNTITINIEEYGNNSTEDEFEGCFDEGIKYIAANYDNFKAYILLTKDPKRVYVACSSNDFATAKEGKRIFAVANQEDALALINGGEFADTGGVGNGAQPIGLTYSKGKCVWGEGSSRKTFIGITNDDKLYVSEGITRNTANDIGIRDGVCFQNGNVLIKSDDAGVKVLYKEGNTGAAQRTAIGQRADGTFIFIVTDGRTASSIGATYNDIIDILVSYGAVNAAMLDGGSSAMLYYENYFDKYSTDKSKLDEYQLKGLTNKYKAFTPPRRIPTYFAVKKHEK